IRSAAATASSTLSATSPLGTAIPCLAKSCLPWNSRRSMGWNRGARGRARRGPYPNAIISRSAMALPSLKNINWVTTDCYGTLIDWEKGIVEAVKKEAAKDGFSFEEQPFLDRFFEVQAEVMAGSYELYAEVLRRSIVKVAGEFGWEIEPSRAQFLPNSVAYWLPFREANAANSAIAVRYVRTDERTAASASAALKPRSRAPIARLAPSRLTSHSNGPGNVSSKSLMSKTRRRSGAWKTPKLERWASPQSCTRRPESGLAARSAAMIPAAPR